MSDEKRSRPMKAVPMARILMLYAFFLPLLYPAAEALFSILLGVTLVAVILGRVRRTLTAFETLIAVFILWRAVTILLSPFPIPLQAFEKICAPLAVLALSRWMDRAENVSGFFAGFFAGTAVAALIGLVEYGLGPEERISSLNSGYITMAFCCTLVVLAGLILMLGGRFRAGLAVLIIPALGLCFTFARTFWGIASIGVFLLALRFKKWLILLPPVAVLLGLLLLPDLFYKRIHDLTDPHSKSFDSERFMLWRMAPNFIAERPLSGWGPESFNRLLPDPVKKDWRDPHISGWHNDFIQVTVESGLPALALWLAIVGWALSRVWPVLRRGVLTDEAARLQMTAALGVVIFLLGCLANGLLSNMMTALCFFSFLPVLKGLSE